MATYARLANADSIEVDNIRSVAGSSVNFPNGLNTDTISEKTATAGVTVDGLLIKDGAIAHTGITAVWSSYTPSTAASGAMTFTGVSFSYAKYIQIGKLVFVTISVSGTVGGVVNNRIDLGLPVTMSAAGTFGSAGKSASPSATTSWFYNTGTGLLSWVNEGFANFAAGACSTIASVFYEAA